MRVYAYLNARSEVDLDMKVHEESLIETCSGVGFGRESLYITLSVAL